MRPRLPSVPAAALLRRSSLAVTRIDGGLRDLRDLRMWECRSGHRIGTVRGTDGRVGAVVVTDHDGISAGQVSAREVLAEPAVSLRYLCPRTS